MSDNSLMNALFGVNEKEKNAVESLIGILSTPIAKRKGIVLTPNECREWANELESFLKNNSI